MPIISRGRYYFFPRQSCDADLETVQLRAHCQRAFHRVAALCRAGGDDFLLQLFWVATQFQPTQIAEDLKNTAFTFRCEAGKPTEIFLDFTMTRLTFAGAIF